MSFFGFARRRRSAPIARERLRILLEYERATAGQKDLMLVLREEILAVIGRHVAVDPEKVMVKVDRGTTVSTLEIDIEVPNVEMRASVPIPKFA
jgi:cell division topological specificity factor